MAHHKPVSKQRWGMAQKAELYRLKKNGSLTRITQASQQRYGFILTELAEGIDEESSILDIGCGPACLAQFIESGSKTFLDPLLDDFRRMFPGTLLKGNYITRMAEEIPIESNSFDLILCFNTLSFTLNPELVLHEVGRLLKPGGTFAVSIRLWPELLARLHYYSTHFMPVSEHQIQLYRYTYHGIRNTLLRHFDIESEKVLPPTNGGPIRFSHERLFICKHKIHATD